MINHVYSATQTDNDIHKCTRASVYNT